VVNFSECLAFLALLTCDLKARAIFPPGLLGGFHSSTNGRDPRSEVKAPENFEHCASLKNVVTNDLSRR
jgi:hypothetical protein